MFVQMLNGACMGKIDDYSVVIDAGPLIHLDELECLDLLDTFSGEVAALALAESCRVNVFLTDDAAARVAGESLGFRVHGTLGIIVRAIRVGTRTKKQVLQLLNEIPDRSSLHISRHLLAEVINTVSDS